MLPVYPTFEDEKPNESDKKIRQATNCIQKNFEKKIEKIAETKIPDISIVKQLNCRYKMSIDTSLLPQKDSMAPTDQKN